MHKTEYITTKEGAIEDSEIEVETKIKVTDKAKCLECIITKDGTIEETMRDSIGISRTSIKQLN